LENSIENDTGYVSCSGVAVPAFYFFHACFKWVHLLSKCCNGPKMAPFNERKKRDFCKLAVIASLADGMG
jgi:hypothetical protein